MGSALLPTPGFLAHYQGYPNGNFKGLIYPKKSHQHPQGLIYPKKSHQHPQSKRKSGHAYGFSPQKSKVRGENPEKKPPLKTKPQDASFPEVGKRAINRIQKASDRKFGPVDAQTLKKEPAKNTLLMGQVTILKRGQTLKTSNKSSSQRQIAKKITGQLIVSPTEIMHPDPRLISKDRTVKSRSVSSKESEAATPPGLETEIAEEGDGIKTPNFPALISEKWAGPAFVNSPSPRSLPLPSFSIKKSGQELAEIDRFATRDLRRLLALD